LSDWRKTSEQVRPSGGFERTRNRNPYEPRQPSCRYLLSRGLQQPPYDAYRLRRAPGVHRPRGPRNSRPMTRITRPTTSSYELQLGFKAFRTPTPGQGPGASQGFCPHSATIGRRDRQASDPAAPRSQVFATSQRVRRRYRLAGLFHPAGTSRVSAFRA
jgi:hypothetical protein